MMGFRSLWAAAAMVCVLAPLGHADIVAQRSLRVGAIVAEGDLVAKDSSAQERADRMIGQEVRRAIFAGRKVAEHNFGPPTLVRRNEPVIMLYRRGALGLRTQGRALSAGGVGDVIEVMNLDTRITVRAMITGQRRVEVRR